MVTVLGCFTTQDVICLHMLCGWSLGTSTFCLQAPASEVQDKISFIINNISTANIEAKGKEVTEILKEHYYPWFAQYMVMKRSDTVWFLLCVPICFFAVLYSTALHYWVLFFCHALLHDILNFMFCQLSLRASIEPNFHDLYLKFLDKVNSKALNKEIVQATYENCKVYVI